MPNHLDHPACREMALPANWAESLDAWIDWDAYLQLCEFVTEERTQHKVFPPADQVFSALEAVAPEQVRVVILGQDPYHGEGQAHGLAFSVLPTVKAPPSLANILKELEADVGVAPRQPCLTPWAERGVLLLNTVLTVRESEANSHQRKGWEKVTDAIIEMLAAQDSPIVFLLWGKPAEKKAEKIGAPHVVLTTSHPSPLSARRGFIGSKPFSSANAALEENGLPPIDWSLGED